MNSLDYYYRFIPEGMTEELYQDLVKLGLDEYDKATTMEMHYEFCRYQHKYHPDEAMYLQTHNPN